MVINKSIEKSNKETKILKKGGENMKKQKLFKKVICFVIALLMLMPSMPGNLTFAYPGDSENDPIPYSPTDPTNFPQFPVPGYVQLNKEASWVEGEEDIAKVQLSLVGKGVPTTTDVVLVIDRSGSMSWDSTVIKPYHEVVLTFNRPESITYQYRQNNNNQSITRSNTSVTMTAYVDDEGVYKGYKSGTLIVNGLDVAEASRYRMDSNSNWFDSWSSYNDNDFWNALLLIFGGKNVSATINGTPKIVAFPNVRDVLKNTNVPYYKKIELAKNAAKEFVSELLKTSEEQDLNKIGIVSYATDAISNSNQTNVNDDLYNAINGIQATGGTNIQSGIALAQQMLSNGTGENKYIVVLSDGQPTFSYKATAATATSAADLALNYPYDVQYKLTSFDTTDIRGNGNDYYYDSGFYNYVYTIGGYTVNNNGTPTISQALIAKKRVPKFTLLDLI
ncbi:MAG: VWA domain-containing protein [Tissierellia bacterium]|nr:VWA domain-containing protein [Tissierellia bacterium]